MQRVLLLLAGIVVLVFGIIVVRTLLHQPVVGERVARVSIELDDSLIARHLAEAIRIRTVSHQRKEDFQAQEFVRFIDWVRQTYPEVNETLRLQIIGDYTLLYRWQGSNAHLKPILLTGHYDVVPANAAQWKNPPFAGEVVDGVIWGRGALDDKSAVIAQLEALTYLIRGGFEPQRTVYFSFGHDEELGGTEGAAAVAEHLASEGVQLEWSLDEGSFVYDGMLPGVDPLVATINVAEKGSVTLNIVASSAGGHSSMPDRQTAVGTLARAIVALEAAPVPGGLSGLSEQMFDTTSRHMAFGQRLPFANRWLLGGVIEAQLEKLTFGNAMLRTTTAPTMLSGSVKVNVLPTEAAATINFRIHPRDTPESVVQHVTSVVENEHVEVRVPAGSGRPASPVSSWEAGGYRTVERAIREIYGDVVVAPGLMIAASDSRHYGKVGDNAYRFNPFIMTSQDLTGFHGVNEKIAVTNLAQGVRAYIRIISHGAMQ